jgi:hypothetical protein
VDVRMRSKCLAPGVEDGDHAGLGTEVLRIAADDANRVRCGLEENIIEGGLILECDCRN